MSFSHLARHRYINLESFKKTGEGVRTPVWFAEDPGTSLDSPATTLFVYSVGDSGKVKRIRNNYKVRLAPCDARGKILGEWVDGRAAIVTGDEAADGMLLLNKKYFPWKQILGFFALFSRKARVVIAIHPG